jgi:hypothetical protein
MLLQFQHPASQIFFFFFVYTTDGLSHTFGLNLIFARDLRVPLLQHDEGSLSVCLSSYLRDTEI